MAIDWNSPYGWKFIISLPPSVARRNSHGDNAARKIAVCASTVVVFAPFFLLFLYNVYNTTERGASAVENLDSNTVSTFLFIQALVVYDVESAGMTYLSDKSSTDKTVENLTCCRKFCPPKYFVSWHLKHVKLIQNEKSLLNVWEIRNRSKILVDKTAEISRWYRKFCPPKSFCPIGYNHL